MRNIKFYRNIDRFFTYFILCLINLFIFCLPIPLDAATKVTVGIDGLLQETKYRTLIEGKRVALITNHTALNGCMRSTVEIFKAQKTINLVALFAPEHGINGLVHAETLVDRSEDADGVPIFSLHGSTRRPTPEMLKGIDVIVFDIQDIGSRSYTYISTLFYVMEEAAKHKIKVIVADRPNPMGGKIVDGLLLDSKLRSFVGYINVPYCHGMTVGELALFFNREYNVDCDLVVIPMKGWKRSMSFSDTGLQWMPTSPQIPEPDTPFFYPTTGILGELQIVNIGVGYTLPFKLVGAPWIDSAQFAAQLNALNLPGVYFHPFEYCPFFGSSRGKECHGVKIIITNASIYLPVTTQYLIIGTLKSLYAKQFNEALKTMEKRREMFTKVNGSEEVYRVISQEKCSILELKKLCQRDREAFLPIRKKYLLPEYED